MWDWVARCFDKYAVFRGRASRPEFWWWNLFLFLANVTVALVGFAAHAFFIPLRILLIAATVVPAWSVTSRRLHDTGHSLWWATAPLLSILPWLVVRLASPEYVRAHPLAGIAFFFQAIIVLWFSVWLIILLCRRGDGGPNRYGDPPPADVGRISTAPAEGGRN